MTDSESSSQDKKKVQQIFRYLQALDQLRNPVQKDIGEQPWQLRLKALPDHHCIERGQRRRDGEEKDDYEGEHHILRVKRPVLQEAPVPPEIILTWLVKGWQDVNGKVNVLQEKEEQLLSQNLYFENEGHLTELLKNWRHELSTWKGNSKEFMPQPPEELLPWLEDGWDKGLEYIKLRNPLVQDAQEVIIHFEDDPERQRSMSNWIADREIWLEKERPARQVMDVFTKLYDLYARLEREAEEYELIVGDGLLEWSDPELFIFHPVLLLRLQLEFDPSIPQFTLLETDQTSELYSALLRLVPDLVPGALSRLQEDLSSGEWHPLGGDDTSEFFKRVVSQLSPYGIFLTEDLKKRPERGPFISRNPVVFLRKRNLGYSAALEAIIQDLPTREDLPQFIRNIVGSSSDSNKQQQKIGGGTPTGIDPNGEDEHILLSKEANAEQLVIAQRLNQNGAVLVQGPPGTGKTHTIANLIGHLLAQGKSILVTSHTSKALQVLHEKIVEPLKPLCISRLNDDNRQQMNSSIDAITERLSASDPDVLEREAAQLQAQRLTLLELLRETRRKLLAARQDEYRSLVIAGEEFSPAQAARFVEANRLGNDWIPGPVAVGQPSPLSQGDLNELYRTNSLLTLADEHESKHLSLQPTQIINPTDFSKLLKEGQQLEGKLTDGYNHLWTKTTNTEPEGLLSLGKRLTRAVEMFEEGSHWSLEVITAGCDGGAAQEVWESLISLVDMVVQQAVQSKKILLEYGPTLHLAPGEVEESESLLADIYQYVHTGGKLSRLKLLTKGKWKGIITKCKVNGLPPSNSEHFEALLCYVRLEKARRKLVIRWQLQILERSGTHALGEVPEQLCSQYCATIKRYLDWNEKQWNPLLLELGRWGFVWEEFMTTVPVQIGTHGRLLRLRVAVIEHLPVILSVRADILLQDKVKKTFDALEILLESQNQSVEVIRQLSEALHGHNPLLYRTAFDRLVELKSKEDAVALRSRLLTQLEKAAPSWGNAIRQRLASHGEGELPGDPKKAWQWRQLNDELDQRNEISMQELQTQIEKLSRDFRTITAVLVEKKAWAAQARRTTLTQRQALQGWKQLIQRVGKGTGKRAPHFKAKASELMPVCQSAVPVWIMPMSRVIENFKPQTNRFDVVIIDEASQADAMALIALYMARQVIVVGDQEQVSPMDIGRNQDDILKLILEHLPGVPNYNLFDGQFSIYALAQTTFEATCLHEHFRCVPPIIQFSNYLSYEGKIQPLRDQSQVTIKPATVLYRVDGAVSKGKTNQKEAQTVISLIMACIEQTEYDKATFGVISMVGEDQAMLIDSLLQKHLPPEEYKARKMQCGNSAHFQGDERTVMFLSMVDASTAGGPLSLRADGAQDMYKKRFNVAASRAKDQMWVVHSLNPSVDLKEGDIRLRLIRHAGDPEAITRSLEHKERKTESEFERLVLRRLMIAGYKVTPQWKVGGFRIDMVVEGGGNQLAVECDGDKYHTMENLRDDLSRQAILERLKWKFVRIRGSEFFRNQEEAMKPVFERLEAMDILPERSADGSEITEQPSSALKERVLRRAAELRREWGYETEIVHEILEMEPQIQLAEDILMGASTVQIKPISLEIENNEIIIVSEDSTIIQTPRAEHKHYERKKLSRDSVVRKETNAFTKTAKARPKYEAKKIQFSEPKMIQTVLEWIETEEEKFDVIAYLTGQGLDVADKRPKGGSLWVVGGLELDKIMKEVSKKGYRFSYSANGGKTTKNHAAWYCNTKESELA